MPEDKIIAPRCGHNNVVNMNKTIRDKRHFIACPTARRRAKRGKFVNINTTHNTISKLGDGKIVEQQHREERLGHWYARNHNRRIAPTTIDDNFDDSVIDPLLELQIPKLKKHSDCIVVANKTDLLCDPEVFQLVRGVCDRQNGACHALVSKR